MKVNNKKTRIAILNVFHRLDINLREKIITDFKNLILKFKKHDDKPKNCVCLRCEFKLTERDNYKLEFNGNDVMESDFCDFLHTNFELFKNIVLSLCKKDKSLTVSNVKSSFFGNTKTVDIQTPPQPPYIRHQ